MAIWDYIKKGFNYATIVGSAFAETGAVQAAKWIGTKGIRAGGKALPIIGNLVSAIDDIYQQYQIHNLQETSEGLVKSQGILKGELEKVQAGLNEGKLASEQFTTELNNIKDELANNSSLTKNEISILKEKQKYFEELQEKNNEAIKHLESVQSEFKAELERNKQALEILSNKVADIDGKVQFNAEEIAQLQELSKESNQRFENLEKQQTEIINKFQEFDARLANIETEFNKIQKEIKELKNQHRQTTQDVSELQAQIKILLEEKRLRDEKERAEKLKEEEILLAKEKELELANKLAEYHSLKVKQKEIERKLKDLTSIPIELPDIEEELNLKPKLFDFDPILNHGIKEAIIEHFSQSTIIYPIAPEQYQLGLNKFGSEVMNFFEVCEDGEESTKPLPTSQEIDNLVNNFQQLFFQNNHISEADFFIKKDLISKLTSNTEILNEMAEELGFSPEKIDESLIKYHSQKKAEVKNQEQGMPGATATMYEPFFLVYYW